MRKLVIKNIFLTITVLFFSVFSLISAIKYSIISARIINIAQNGGPLYAHSSALVAAENFSEKYRSMKSAFSLDESFVDLIPDSCHAATLVDCGNDEPSIEYIEYYETEKKLYDSVISNFKGRFDGNMCFYFQELEDKKVIHITEGRAVNITKPYDGSKPLEIMVPENCEFAIGSELFIETGLFDSDNNTEIIISAIVVGKFSQIKPFPSLNQTYSEYIFNGNSVFEDCFLAENIADVIDISKQLGNAAGDFEGEYNIELLPVFSDDKTDPHFIYRTITENGGIVLQNQSGRAIQILTFTSEWQNLYTYLELAVFFVLVFIATISVYIPKQIAYCKKYKND